MPENHFESLPCRSRISIFSSIIRGRRIEAWRRRRYSGAKPSTTASAGASVGARESGLIGSFQQEPAAEANTSTRVPEVVGRRLAALLREREHQHEAGQEKVAQGELVGHGAGQGIGQPPWKIHGPLGVGGMD